MSLGKILYWIKTGEFHSGMDALLLAAEKGSAKAQLALGERYAGGDGVPEDDARAVQWFRMAARQGHTQAQFYMGRAYMEGDGFVRSYESAYAWFVLAADQGHKVAAEWKARAAEKMTPEQIREGRLISKELMIRGVRCRLRLRMNRLLQPGS